MNQLHPVFGMNPSNRLVWLFRQFAFHTCLTEINLCFFAIRLLEGLEEQEVKGFNRGPHSKLETMQMQEFVEDLGFWRVLLLLVVIALLSLGIAYYVSGVLPFSSSQLELVH
uniref:Uncharacterized protein n=1 Tax=Anabas testudineus TaxID=64144 RepID=A0A7N6BZN3_ANATE